VDDAGRPQSVPRAGADRRARPRLPWALPLTDEQGRFHLVAFDLDLGHGDGNVVRDARQLTDWLNQLRIEHTVAQSGPSGGRHVWLSMLEPTPAELISVLADHAGTVLPTLDLSPLKNSAWGSVRPPGAPHRFGGHSVILTGPDEPLRPAVTVEQLTRLVVVIAGAAATTRPHPVPPPVSTPLPVDSEGHRYLPGQRRPLPAASARALAGVPVDASAAAFTVLLGAARARWHLADVVAVLHEPGLKHIRTERDAAGRRQRDPRTRQRMLARQWNKAVLAVLLAARLVARTAAGWRRIGRDGRGAAARRFHCDGILAGRRHNYEKERILWAWWCDELDWMRLPRTDPAKRRRAGRIAAGQLTIDGTTTRGRYPRRGDGSTDHRAAALLAA